MRYIKVVMETCYTGIKEEYIVAKDNITDDDINKLVKGMVDDLADTYAYLATDYIYIEDYASEEEYEEAIAQAEEEVYNQNIYYYWEEISKEDIENVKTWTEVRKTKGVKL